MMNLSRLTEVDLFGRIWIPGTGNLDSYYASLQAIRELISSEQWQNSVSGFSINAENYAVRIYYFTSTPETVRELAVSFLDTHKIEYRQPLEYPFHHKVSHAHGGEERRFRKFLSTYTIIGLEIMQKDLLHARCLFTTFRLQVIPSKQEYKPHFLRTFEQQSDFYNSLSAADKDQFWNDLINWPPQSEEWAHMFVNMVLGCDLDSQRPLTITEINANLQRLRFGFQIRQGWLPEPGNVS